VSLCYLGLEYLLPLLLYTYIDKKFWQLKHLSTTHAHTHTRAHARASMQSSQDDGKGPTGTEPGPVCWQTRRKRARRSPLIVHFRHKKGLTHNHHNHPNHPHRDDYFTREKGQSSTSEDVTIASTNICLRRNLVICLLLLFVCRLLDDIVRKSSLPSQRLMLRCYMKSSSLFRFLCSHSLIHRRLHKIPRDTELVKQYKKCYNRENRTDERCQLRTAIK
jgi:hypothetical protein